MPGKLDLDFHAYAERPLAMKTVSMVLVAGALFASVALLGLPAALAQGSAPWPPQQRIPVYERSTWPPILIADRKRIVHAFSSQWIRTPNGSTVRAVNYNQWSLGQGWTAPVDILLSPLENDARVLDAYVDPTDRVHLIFWGGNDQGANIYYSSAPLAEAGNSHAWSVPVVAAANAGDPENGVFLSRDSSPVVILFSGRQDGNGLYTTSSNDQGQIWSKPILVAAIHIPGNIIGSLKAFESSTGWNRVVWNEDDIGGQGHGIYYIQKRSTDTGWNGPVLLASAETGYGTNTPAVIEYHGNVLAFFNLDAIIWQRTSPDGQNWNAPKQLYPRHVGVNGSIALVVDDGDTLHMLFGQRITGSPDIHGMWHSVLRGTYWSEPEAVVSGPAIGDHQGDRAFDPYEARTVVIQGNVLLVTWRSDPGDNGNGVWYSVKILDAPELPAQPVATVPASRTPDANSAETQVRPSPTQAPVSSATQSNLPPVEASRLAQNPVASLIVGIVPVVLFITAALALTWLLRQIRN